MSPTHHRFELSLMPDHHTIVRLAPDAPVPPWAAKGTFFSITHTADELSIVCAAQCVPANLRSQINWRVFKVHGPFALPETGVLSALAAPLAKAEISLFVISTFDTDYLLVNAEQLDRAVTALEGAGHTIHDYRPVS
jgi:uncharacterized protein